jgi:hypothetical protein
MKQTKYSEFEEQNQIIVQKYFNKIKKRDIEGVLDLFSNDSVIEEPFSKSKILLGKSEIEPFLKSVIMANEGLKYKINIERQKNNHKNDIVAFVIFSKEHFINSKFTFNFENNIGSKKNNKISSLKIEFTD